MLCEIPGGGRQAFFLNIVAPPRTQRSRARRAGGRLLVVALMVHEASHPSSTTLWVWRAPGVSDLGSPQ